MRNVGRGLAPAASEKLMNDESTPHPSFPSPGKAKYNFKKSCVD